MTDMQLQRGAQHEKMERSSVRSSAFLVRFVLSVTLLCIVYQMIASMNQILQTSDTGVVSQSIEYNIQLPTRQKKASRFINNNVKRSHRRGMSNRAEQRINKDFGLTSQKVGKERGNQDRSQGWRQRTTGKNRNDEQERGEEENFDLDETIESTDNNNMMDKADRLWHGRATTSDFVDPHHLPITVILSHCLDSLSWLHAYTADFQFRSFTIVSKCGVHPNVKHLPEGSKVIQMQNVGRIDHTIAHWMAQVLPTEKKDDNEEIFLFLKDNTLVHTVALLRSLETVLDIASADGFCCALEPQQGISFFHLTDVLGHFNMQNYKGVAGRKNSPEENPNEVDFKSEYENMAAWLHDMGISLPRRLSPVCYGGIFAVTRSQIAKVPQQIWRNMERSLSRGDNIEEGHFAERTWAGLLYPPLTSEEVDLLIARSGDVAYLHDAMRGALLEL